MRGVWRVGVRGERSLGREWGGVVGWSDGGGGGKGRKLACRGEGWLGVGCVGFLLLDFDADSTDGFDFSLVCSLSMRMERLTS